MRMFSLRRSNLLSAISVFFLTLLLAACDLPLSDSGALIAADSATALDEIAAPRNGGATSGICDATTASTVLTPVPAPPRDGAPIDVRIHYNRGDGNYADWGLHLWQINDAGQYIADYPGVAWTSPLVRTGIDSYGAYFDLRATQFTNPAAAGFGFIVHPPGQGGDPGVDRTLKFTDGGEFWLRSGDATVYRSNPLGSTPDIDTVRVHYKRFDNAYDQWGLHLWPTSGIDPSRLAGLTIDQWGNPVPLASMPNYATGSNEVTFDLPVLNPQGDANRSAVEFIIHGLPSNPNGGVNNKDGWNDNIRVSYASLSISGRVGQIWLVQGEPRVFTSPPNTRRVSTTDARAVWLTRNLLKWPQADDFGTFKLYHSANGQIVAPRGQPVTGADGALTLQLGGSVPAAAAERFKYVDAGVVLAVSAADEARLGDVLKQQVVLVQEDTDGKVLAATTTQLAGVLDERYAAAEAIDDLGVSFDRGRAAFKLWAPTARKVTLCTYGAQGVAYSEDAMTFDATTGVWTFGRRSERRHGHDDDDDDDGKPRGRYYKYAVEVFVRGVGVVRNLVTDPYSISLNANSQRSYIGDLDSPWLMPPGWRRYPAPNSVRAQEDMSVYELQVRDFSANDSTVSARNRGKYLAFTEWNSNGMRHLRGLAQAGVTDVHLLPVFDFASTPETGCITPTIPNAAPDSDAQQAAAGLARGTDCFNWGYDPWHFNAPEGSYASNADDGAARIREFRAMVMALNLSGLRVGMDVVYNHTSASGQNDKSVLDRIVPGYYQRLNAAGDIERSTCCENTATENRMMGKLMIDSVKQWATQYRIDSFRFDLMGHQPRAVMEKLRDDVSAAAGRPIQLIGEGWNFGEVANGTRFVQASQLSLNGSGIGTFSDRARDHVRGGSGFDSGVSLLRNQGYINGLYYDDNGSGGNKSRNDLMWSADVIKVGLAGSIRDYVMKTHWDATLRLDQIDYGGQPAGYVVDPQEVVNYVENHDNWTLFDNNALKLPTTTSREDRARVQILGAAINSFSQGVAYFHAGVDTLRSKSLDRNSYDSGDWFNRIDWSYKDNGFGAGLPPQGDNGDNWSVMGPLLANAQIKPTEVETRWTRGAFRDLMKIRASSRLFRLRTADEIKQRLAFRNTGSTQVPTVLAAHLDGSGYPGAGFREVLYFINVDKVGQTLTIPEEAGKQYRLHPVHTAYDAADRRAAAATYDRTSGRFTVPPRTAVVFVVR
jgi:pullulanase